MKASTLAQDQIASLMADTMPSQILSFKFSASVQDRINDLVSKKKEQLIDNEENEELEKYLMYDLLIGLAKARAFKFLNLK